MPVPEPAPIRRCSDPRIRFENRPCARQSIRYRDRAGHARTELVTVNELGCRGRAVPCEKPAGSLRIVVLGDSQTFGAGVPESGTWPAVLERSLAEARPSPPLDVLNCAVAGYDAEQSAAALEERWLAFDPDLVLLGYFVNDPPIPPRRAECADSASRRLLNLVTPGKQGFLASLRSHSALFDLVSAGLYRRLRVREWATGADYLHREGTESWQRTEAAILRERLLCGARGASFGVVLLPLLVAWEDGLISTGPYARVRAFCEAQGIPVVDLEPLFAGRDLEALLVHEKDFHSGAEAHRMQGEAVAAWVLDEGLLRSEALAAGGN